MTMSKLKNRSGVFQYFLDRRVAGENAAQSVLAQRDHTELDRLLLENNRRRAFVDQFADWIGNFHQLVNSLAAFVASVVTRVATLAIEKLAISDVAFRNFELRKQRIVRLVGRAAIRTNAAKQTLPDDRFESRGNQKRLDAHVDQTSHGARRVICMERRENKMAGKRCLNRDLRRLQIARLPNHDAIGILSQERAQHTREAEADVFVDRNLNDSFQIILNS